MATDNHGYPEDRKDPAVFVDMTSEEVPPPSFDEATEPLLSNEEKGSGPIQLPADETPVRRGRCLFGRLANARRSEERAE
ncbi:hypothetical protein BGZ83_010808, partial [Gryganskiella cystojenkinii]